MEDMDIEIERELFERERRNQADHIVAMNFKVSFEFRQAMKFHALKNGLSLRELFIKGIELAMLGQPEKSRYSMQRRAFNSSLSAGDPAESESLSPTGG